MLYKKYHRNFVRQFKEGTKFEYMYLDDSKENTVHICCRGEPMIERNRWDHTCCIQIPISRDDYRFDSKFTLIFSDGIIEDVEVL